MKDASLTFGEISSVSTFIETAVWSRVEAVKRSKEVAVGTPVGSSAVEFDDVRLHVNSVNGSSALEVSVGAPSGAFDAKSAREDAQKLLDGELVKVNERANSGYDLTASVDVDALAAIEDEAKRAEAVRQIARLRCVIYGSKLRKHLRTLAETGGEEGPLDWTTHRPRETMFIKPQNEQVTVVFPMRFEDARDAAIANTFLAQFAEVRRGQKDLSTAPAVSYHKTPPLELNDAPAGETNALDANGGYVSFVLFKRHCTAERLESTVWNIMTFYAFVSYHIKYSKAYWHSRMRAKVDSWLSILKRARKIDPNAEKKMVTASGRTFVRK